ncbi:hypothetical protein ILUMI_25319 [Ignelater luminosus]|uniref:Uncharacterized protein n=1 Tax=Ignelater luminosus TaxID=2038154 RepID=A0A8K0C4X0_IGNLU|nr:hypothetical protein ILUMI_25319 [Ignelater luminosus]
MKPLYILEEEAKEIWKELNPLSIPTIPSLTDTARLKALQYPESGAWLQAIPSSDIGTLMDNNSFRVCVVLQIGSLDATCTDILADSHIAHSAVENGYAAEAGSTQNTK